MKAKGIILKTTQKCVGEARKFVSKNSPTILIIAGAVGVVAGTVLAARAGKFSEEKTRKAKEDLVDIREHKEEICAAVEATESANAGKIEYGKKLAQAYGRLIFVYAKLYGPAAATTLFSLFLIFSAHKILQNRFTAAYLGFTTVSKAYDQYRQNVIDEEGEEADERYRFGIKEIIEELPVLDKDGNPKLDKEGNPKTIKKSKNVISKLYFDPRSILWDPVTAYGLYDDSTCNTPMEEQAKLEYNVATIRLAQAAANNKMKARSRDPRGDGIGWITWEEIADSLHVKLNKHERKVGKTLIWRYDPRLDPNEPEYDPHFKKPDDWGNNEVNFGLDDPNIPGYKDRQRFLAGCEDGILLYMNYDGTIFDLW